MLPIYLGTSSSTIWQVWALDEAFECHRYEATVFFKTDTPSGITLFSTGIISQISCFIVDLFLHICPHALATQKWWQNVSRNLSQWILVPPGGGRGGVYVWKAWFMFVFISCIVTILDSNIILFLFLLFSILCLRTTIIIRRHEHRQIGLFINIMLPNFRNSCTVNSNTKSQI